MVGGRCSCAGSLLPIRSSAPEIPLSSLFPLHPAISLVSPLFPLDTKTMGAPVDLSVFSRTYRTVSRLSLALSTVCAHVQQKQGGRGERLLFLQLTKECRRADILSPITYCARDFDGRIRELAGGLSSGFWYLGLGVSFFLSLSLLRRDCCRFPVFWRRRGHRRNFRTRSRRAWHRRISGW